MVESVHRRGTGGGGGGGGSPLQIIHYKGIQMPRVPCAVCRVPCAVCRVPCAVCRVMDRQMYVNLPLSDHMHKSLVGGRWIDRTDVYNPNPTVKAIMLLPSRLKK